jgi:hypothetical protein
MNYRIVPVQFAADRETVISLWTRNLPSHNQEEHALRYDWVYRQNPIGPGILFLAYHETSGKPIGTAGIGLRTFRWNSKAYPAGIAVDFVVDAEHRNAQAALLLSRAVITSVPEKIKLLYGFPNTYAESIFRRIGYVKLGKAKKFVKVLRSVQYLQRRSVPQLLIRSIAASVDLGLRLASSESSTSQRAQVCEISPSDERLSALLSECGAQGEHLEMERSPEYLQWRYQNCPLHCYSLLGVSTRNQEEFIGYAALEVTGETVVIGDLFYSSRRGAAETLLGGIARWSRARACNAISLDVANPGPIFLKALRRLGFVERGESEPLMVLDHPEARMTALPSWQMLRDR